MVDRTNRDVFAHALRRFAIGKLTNDEYEEIADPIVYSDDCKDRAIWAVHTQVWFWYDDFTTHTLTEAHALTPEERHEVARWVMFLYSDREYEWPITSNSSAAGCLLALITLGLWWRFMEPAYQPKLEEKDDAGIWPFRFTHDYERSLRKPRFFHGAT